MNVVVFSATLPNGSQTFETESMTALEWANLATQCAASDPQLAAQFKSIASMRSGLIEGT